jgi:hypothetical protein
MVSFLDWLTVATAVVGALAVLVFFIGPRE